MRLILTLVLLAGCLPPAGPCPDAGASDAAAPVYALDDPEGPARPVLETWCTVPEGTATPRCLYASAEACEASALGRCFRAPL